LRVDLQVGGGSGDKVPALPIEGGQFKEPLRLRLEQPLAKPLRWSVVIRRDDGQVLWQRAGEGAPPDEIVWPGTSTDGQPALGEGQKYSAQLTVEDGTGGRGSSPERVFATGVGKNIETAVAGQLFSTKGTPTPKLQQFIAKTAEAIKTRPPTEKVRV